MSGQAMEASTTRIWILELLCLPIVETEGFATQEEYHIGDALNG